MTRTSWPSRAPRPGIDSGDGFGSAAGRCASPALGSGSTKYLEQSFETSLCSIARRMSAIMKPNMAVER
jgi:hypothetical protein